MEGRDSRWAGRLVNTLSPRLCAQRGFYIVDGTHRLFTMPFREASKEEEEEEEKKEERADGDSLVEEDDAGQQRRRVRRRPPLTMWQLSFSGVSEEEGLALRGASPAQLLAEAARRMAGWMDPVPEMVGGEERGEGVAR